MISPSPSKMLHGSLELSRVDEMGLQMLWQRIYAKQRGNGDAGSRDEPTQRHASIGTHGGSHHEANWYDEGSSISFYEGEKPECKQERREESESYRAANWSRS